MRNWVKMFAIVKSHIDKVFYWYARLMLYFHHFDALIFLLSAVYSAQAFFASIYKIVFVECMTHNKNEWLSCCVYVPIKWNAFSFSDWKSIRQWFLSQSAYINPIKLSVGKAVRVCAICMHGAH